MIPLYISDLLHPPNYILQTKKQSQDIATVIDDVEAVEGRVSNMLSKSQHMYAL